MLIDERLYKNLKQEQNNRELERNRYFKIKNSMDDEIEKVHFIQQLK